MVLPQTISEPSDVGSPPIQEGEQLEFGFASGVRSMSAIRIRFLAWICRGVPSV